MTSNADSQVGYYTMMWWLQLNLSVRFVLFTCETAPGMKNQLTNASAMRVAMSRNITGALYLSWLAPIEQDEDLTEERASEQRVSAVALFGNVK